jgi:protein-disulfide isomerase
METGELRFGYIHFAFLGPESQWAAEASECAADQDAFWEYYDLLYTNQNGENRGAFSKDNLKRFASDIGLDTDLFNECLDTDKYTSLVQQEYQLSQQIGVSSTPTFILNGRPVIGAQPFEVFQQQIQTALSEAK